MKLNLLPTTVNREGRAKGAWFFSILLALAGAASMFFMKSTSERFIAEQNARIEKAAPTVTENKRIEAMTDKLINDNRGIIMNAKLADAMQKHSDVYPDLLTEIKQYIPSFFRITQMAATPNGDAAQVNISGVIHTQQQYADLMLALLRIKDVVSVGRTGFNFANALVPPLTQGDQTGRLQQPGDPTWPDDPMARMEAQIAQARSTGFLGQEGWGTTAEPMQRGPMPDWSAINVAVVIRRNIQSPNPIGAINETKGMWPAPTPAGGGAGGSATPASGTATTPTQNRPAPQGGGRE